ncbi:MAG: Wzz/FepE/Etk N-terminal domain-containing protein [Sulfurospirillum sp.]
MQQKTLNQHAILEEDEIDLRELWQTIIKHKKKILLFSVCSVLVVLVALLSTPNQYETTVSLAPQSQTKTSALGGLSALAGMAGLDIGGSSEVSTADYLSTLLQDYAFNVKMIEKYHLDKKIEGNDANFVFALGFRGFYDLFHTSKEDSKKSREEILFETTGKLSKILAFSSDKKSGIMTLKVTSEDRFFAKELVEIYLKEMTDYVRVLDMQDTEQKIAYYRDEMSKKDDVELKKNLASLVSSLIQKSVLAKSSEFYLVKPITTPEVANFKDKTKPKRGLILVVTLVTSLILGIFGAFFVEFLQNTKEKKSVN